MVSALDGSEREPLLQNPNSQTNQSLSRYTDDEAHRPSSGSKGTLKAGDSNGESIEDVQLDWKTFVAIVTTWIGVFFASMDSSVMATLTGPISTSFDSFKLLIWFINAYNVAQAAIQPLSGKLSDIYGRKTGLVTANIFFLVGNIMCGIASQNWQFILGRAIAGLGGGAIHSICTFVLSDFIPLRSRGWWQGISNISYGTGFAFGGFIGGFVADRFGWRWIFIAQVVPVVISLGLVWWLLPDVVVGDKPRNISSIRRVDFLGSFTLTIAVLTLLFGTISGGNTLPWSSPLVYSCFIVAPILLVGFAVIEEFYAVEPVIPVRLLKDRTIGGSCLNNGFSSMAQVTFVYYLPLYLQVEGLSASQAGLRVIPTSVGVFLGSLCAGALINITGRYYILGNLCQVLLIAATILSMTVLSTFVSTWAPFVMMFMSGTGYGGSLTVSLIALISAAQHTYHAQLTSASYAFRSIGFVLGQTIAGAIFQNIFNRQLWKHFGSRPDASEIISGLRHQLTIIKDVPQSLRDGVADSYEMAFQQVWTFAMVFAVLGAVAFVFVRENHLHRTISRT